MACHQDARGPLILTRVSPAENLIDRLRANPSDRLRANLSNPIIRFSPHISTSARANQYQLALSRISFVVCLRCLAHALSGGKHTWTPFSLPTPFGVRDVVPRTSRPPHYCPSLRGRGAAHPPYRGGQVSSLTDHRQYCPSLRGGARPTPRTGVGMN